MITTGSFTTTKKELLTALVKIQRLEKAAKKLKSTLEITVINNFISLSIPGTHVNIKAETNVKVKFTLPLWYIIDVVKSEQDKKLVFHVQENELKLRGLTFSIKTQFIDTDALQKKLLLPINYTYYNVLKLYLSGNYTIEEMIFDDIDKNMIAALKNDAANIVKAFNILKRFSISIKDIETLAHDRLNTLFHEDKHNL